MTGKILTFHLNNELFGIDIGLVKEINRKIKYTPIPGGPEYIIGLFNMRGQVVTIFDFVYKLWDKKGHIPDSPTCIILKSQSMGNEHIGFLVDRAEDVLDVSPELCEPLPGNIDHIDQQYIREMVKFEDDLIMIVNPDKILSMEDHN
ncbi:MAG TPA: chemotaxis protein CheW [Clostridia bacterium]|nr:chemotaxis protein CheW [Clostridia bacterium]